VSCDYAELDGSYVLGALAPSERRDFEQHLPGCKACTRAVRDLAGLPGLLARVDRIVLDDPPPAEPVPPTLLPTLVHEVRRSARRRTVVTAGLAAAAALVVAGGAVAVTDAVHVSGETVGGTVVAAQQMRPVGHPPMSARVSLATVDWGTRLDLTCRYAPVGDGAYHQAQAQDYALVVRTADGRTEQVATWRALPGRQMRLTAATRLDAAEITAVEVRLPDGRPVLRLRT
jgi:hypothetical protein